MAIGTLAAVALGAATIGSAAISKSASNKAADAATQAANESAKVQREQLQAAQGALSPYQSLGLPAGQTLNALLGLGGSTGGTASGTMAGQPVGSVDWASYVRGNPDALANWDSIKNISDGAPFGGDIAAFGAYHFNKDGARRDLTPYTVQAQTQGSPTNALAAQTAAQGAYDTFKNSIGYQNTMNEAMRGVNSLYAGAGTLKSGAAIKGAQDRASQIAQGTLGTYMGYLGNQQALGMSAGSALAGVGQNYANSIGNINSARADAVGNSALLNASNTNSLLGGLTAGIFRYGVK